MLWFSIFSHGFPGELQSTAFRHWPVVDVLDSVLLDQNCIWALSYQFGSSMVSNANRSKMTLRHSKCFTMADSSTKEGILSWETKCAVIGSKKSVGWIIKLWSISEWCEIQTIAHQKLSVQHLISPHLISAHQQFPRTSNISHLAPSPMTDSCCCWDFGQSVIIDAY